jgi:hypothetical protein
MRFQQAEIYAQEHGHCNVPYYWIENPQLANWIKKQRELHRERINSAASANDTITSSTTQELWNVREKRLESIGIDWQPLESAWWRNWERLRFFWKKYGHHKVPRVADANLYEWVWNQRRLCRKYQMQLGFVEDGESVKVVGLSEDRIKALKEIDFWNEPSHNATFKRVDVSLFAKQGRPKKNDKRPNLYDPIVWDILLQELVDFSNQHGHTCVSKEANISQVEHRQLDYFCRTCRLHYRYFYDLVRNHSKTSKNCLTKDRIQQLNDIGFVWNADDAKWNMRFKQLSDFLHAHGHCNVPQNYVLNFQLGNWVYRRTTRKKMLSEDFRRSKSVPLQEEWEQRFKRLESIGFDWNPDNDIWMRMWEQLRDFRRKHGHYGVNRLTEPELTVWVYTQRRYIRDYKKKMETKNDSQPFKIWGLNDVRIKALKEIGFWDEE